MEEELFASRFRVLSEIGRGGMGTVHRAVEVATGRDVALKRMLVKDEGAHLSRFIRESQLLGRISHPNIVAYVGHDPHHDPPWLAMEWLRGCDLAVQLARAPLAAATALSIAADIAGALGSMHMAGLVHRDLKPSNVFVLEGGGPPCAKLIDLGVTLDVSDDATLLTSAGTVIGSPLYMSPEQARGEPLDARSDVWSLGVLLFEMLSGASPFGAGSPVAVLAKILVGDIPRLASVRTDISATLDDLVAEMLTRDLDRRPPNAASLELRLRSIVSTQAPPHDGTRPPREIRLLFVLMVLPGAASHAARAMEDLRSDGARVERMRDGTLVALYGAERSSTDDALRCARSALALRARDPHARIALALSRGESTGASDALERAASLLQRAMPGHVATDATTVGVIGPQAQWVESGGRTLLRGLSSGSSESESAAIVGREAELGALEGLCRSAWQDESTHGALVVGEPGVGKSRLLAELVRRVASAETPPLILTCAADTRTAEVPYALVGAALRALTGLHAGLGPEEEEKTLSAWVGAILATDSAGHLPFLCEIIGLRLDTLAESRAMAPERLRAELARSWLFLLQTLASKQPVLVLAEDLQWADHASANLLLRTLDLEAPIAVVASARSDGREAQRAFLEHPGMKEIPLRGLSARASERLLRLLLPQDANPLASVIVARAGGNPLFLRELARAPHLGTATDLPASLELVVQQRFDALAVEVREIARVAAAFGDTAYIEGIRYVVDRDSRRDVASLVSTGILVYSATSAIPPMTELTFRHSFLRETAERMTVPEDARTYHERIYSWLQHVGVAVEPQILARHAELAGNYADALALYTSGAANAVRVFQLEDAVGLFVHSLRVAVIGRLLVENALRVLEALDTNLQSVRVAAGALDAVERALTYIDAAGTPDERVRAKITAASIFGVESAFERSNALFEEAAVLLGNDVSQLRRLYLRRARQAEVQGQLDAADRYMSRVQELLSDELPTSDLLLRHAAVAASLEDFARADDYLSRARELVRSDVDTLAVLKVEAIRHYFANDDRTAHAVTVRAVALARQIGLTYELALQLHNAGDLASALEEGAATELLEESTRLCVLHGFERLEKNNRAFLSYLAAVERGDDAQLAAFARAQAKMLEDGYLWESVTHGLRLARAYQSRGRRSDAVRTAKAMLAVTERYSFLRIRRELGALLAELEPARAAEEGEA